LWFPFADKDPRETQPGLAAGAFGLETCQKSFLSVKKVPSFHRSDAAMDQQTDKNGYDIE
jgi:hypothetical protein